MGDPIYHHQQFTGDRQQQQQLQRAMSSGLARYQSAPSSYFASLLDSSMSGFVENYNEFVTERSSTPKQDQVFARSMPPGNSEGSSFNEVCGIQQNSSVNNSQQSQFMAAPMKNKSDNYIHDQQMQRQGSEYTIPPMIHQNQSQSQSSFPNHTLPMSKPPIDSSYVPQMNISSGRSSNLLRQSSSPADFFTNFDIKDYCVGKSTENFGSDKKFNIEASYPPPNGLKRQRDFSSGLPSSSGIMPPISEIENKNMEMSGTGFAFSSWDDSDIFSDGFLKGLEDERKTFSNINASENQNDEVGSHCPPTLLSRHLSLPKTSAMEKFLQLQDSVPCKIRAKRGCATHPRSIAERVRRTRISERMRKLQDLVPNMDKQTNTSDMLDLAVDYIKDLQNQLETLSDNRARCTCSNQQLQ